MLDLIYKFDFSILDSIQNIRTPILDKIMTVITLSGSGGAIWIAIAIIFLFIKNTRACGIKMLVGLLLGAIIAIIGIKYLVARERPFTFDNAKLMIDNLIISPPMDRYSFPSGHAISSFTAAFIMFNLGKKTGVCAIILASIISFSRLYVYVHFPTDIIGGMVFAIPIVIITNIIVDKLLKRRSV